MRQAHGRRKSVATSIATVLFAITTIVATPARAHPHAFVDGGVNFVFSATNTLEALDVLWLFDEFETLYTLSALELNLDGSGKLTDVDRQTLRHRMSEWSEEFTGSAHPSTDGERIELAPPSDVDVHLVDGRLQTTFTRHLKIPLALEGRSVEVAFYEATHFYDFSVTNPPQLLEHDGNCSARVIPFVPDEQSEAMAARLLALDREETPAMEAVGAIFADRIVVSCE